MCRTPASDILGGGEERERASVSAEIISPGLVSLGAVSDVEDLQFLEVAEALHALIGDAKAPSHVDVL